MFYFSSRKKKKKKKAWCPSHVDKLPWCPLQIADLPSCPCNLTMFEGNFIFALKKTAVPPMVLMLHPAFVYADRDNANHPIQYNGTWLRGYTVHATVKLYLPAYTWY